MILCIACKPALWAVECAVLSALRANAARQTPLRTADATARAGGVRWQRNRMWTRREACLAALCFLIVAPMTNAEALSEADVKNLLTRIRENRITQADFQEQRIIRLMQKPIVNSGKVWFQPPNKFRREVKGNSPSLTVSDGQQLWIYYPNFKSAERYSLGKRSPLDSIIASINAALNLENVENIFNITATRTGPPQAGYELELTPRTASMKRAFQKLNLRINDKLQAERTDMLLPNGDRIVSVYTNQTRAQVPPSTFQFTPPPGTDIATPLGQ
jgi:outer membrane lipoprotein carrier protein